jgi:biotin-(acetyl-CoA carboxylase) ligase
LLFDLAEEAQEGGFEVIRSEWNIRDASAGQSYILPGPKGPEIGTAAGVAASGALIVRFEGGEVRESIHATASAFGNY